MREENSGRLGVVIGVIIVLRSFGLGLINVGGIIMDAWHGK